MSLRSTCTISGALCLLLATHSAAADEYKALMKAKKYAEVNSVANAVLAKDPDNAKALIMKATLITLQAPETRMDEAVALAEKCVAAHPRNSDCHDALGSVVSSRALMAGIMSSLGSAGKIRDSFKTAIELDPHNMAARFHLLQYYMQAPAFVGGGVGKAKTLALDTANVNAEGSKMMLAMIDYMADNAATAEAIAWKVQPGGDEDIADMQRDILLGVAWKHMHVKQPDRAIHIFRELQKRFAAAEGAPFGIAVVMQGQGKHQEAIVALQQAIAISPNPEFEYHMGLSWQAMRDTPKAISVFEKALAAKPGLKKHQKLDAENRLKILKG